MAMELVTKLPYDHPYRWDGTPFGGPKLWRPNNIGSSLALWLDAEDTTTITLNGSSVSQWNDKSGNGRNVTQGTAANQPTYQAAGLNSKPTLSFDGTNDFLLGTSNIGLSGNPSFSLFTVQTGVAASSQVWVASGQNIAGKGVHWMSGSTGTVAWLGFDGFTQTATVTLSPSSATPFIASLLRTGTLGTDYSIFQNGNNLTVTSANNNTVNLTDTPINIGRYVSNSNFANMKFSETVLVYGAINTSDRQKMEGYLAWKWGLNSSLPSNHPYKSLPPTV